jgi:ketosteroid isomerase-like protein
MPSAEDEREAALQANARFYRALAGGDFSAMESLWARAEAVLCIHPGGEPLHGREAVMASWEAILATPPAIRFDAPRVEIVRGLAFVTGIETVAGQRLAATNVFVWEAGRWRLSHHQAGHVAVPVQGAAPDGETLH